MARENIDLLIARAERNSRSGRAARRKLARVARGSSKLLARESLNDKVARALTLTVEIAQKVIAAFNPDRIAKILGRAFDELKREDRVTFKV